MFDRFKPLHIIDKFDFTFRPTRYELWMNQRKVKHGAFNSMINGKVLGTPEDSIVRVSIDGPFLSEEIARAISFDEFLSQTDRLQLLTIPESTIPDCNGLVAVRSVIGPTIYSKNFASNEPYCCSLFFKNSELNMVTFSFSNPVKLLEFYCD